MTHPRCAFGASPFRGRYQWPGEAGSTVSLDHPRNGALRVAVSPSRGRYQWPGEAGSTVSLAQIRSVLTWVTDVAA